MAEALRTARTRSHPRLAARSLHPSDIHLPQHFRGRHHLATAVAVALVAIVAFRAFPLREVTVLHDGEAVPVRAAFDPRAESLVAAAVGLEPEDRVRFASGGRHASLAIERAQPVRIDVDGNELALRTQAMTIGGALAAAGVSLHPGDRVYAEGRLTTASAVIDAPLLATGAGDGGVRIVVARARPATVFLDRTRIETNTSATTVEGVLGDLGLIVREGDLVQPPLQTPFSAGMVIHLAKAKTLSVILDGKPQALYTAAHTVDDVLRVLGVELGAEDYVFPLPGSFVADGETVTIGLTRTVEEVTETPIPAPVRYETDASLAPGAVRIVRGTDGALATTYSVTYRAGVETARETVSTATTREPVATRHITSGRSAAASPPILNAPDYTGPYVRKLTVYTTWYNASHGGKTPDDPLYGITATGAQLEYGICATDPDVIPLGTLMYIPRYGKCVAADVGGGVRGNHVDLGFPESAGQSPWGAWVLEIYILP